MELVGGITVPKLVSCNGSDGARYKQVSRRGKKKETVNNSPPVSHAHYPTSGISVSSFPALKLLTYFLCLARHFIFGP